MGRINFSHGMDGETKGLMSFLLKQILRSTQSNRDLEASGLDFGGAGALGA